MDFCNYLHNVSSLVSFIEMGHYETKILPGYLDFWIEVGSDCSMRFDQYGFSFDFVYVSFCFKEFCVEYYRDAEEMSVIWYLIKEE